MPAYVDLQRSLKALARYTTHKDPELQGLYDQLRLSTDWFDPLIVFNEEEDALEDEYKILDPECRLFVFMLEAAMASSDEWQQIEALRRQVLKENKLMPRVGITIKFPPREVPVTRSLKIEAEKPNND